MGVARTPAQYNWKNLEFNETLLLPRNFTAPRQRKIRFVVIHHMIVLNRDYAKNDATRACYDIWINQGRQASANYGVDGDFVDQFVYDGNASWANANYEANHSSITIEHANKTLDMPGTANDYLIDDKTFFTGAKLTAYVHLKYGITPKFNVSVRKHSHFHPTACPGPYMDRNWRRYFDLMHDIYNGAKSGRHIPAPEKPKRSIAQPAKLSVEAVAREVISGVWGNGPERLHKLKAAGYNPTEVQNQVNRLLGGAKTKSIDTVAREVLKGSWGNGSDRYNRLLKAGYNPKQVQDRVNALLR